MFFWCDPAQKTRIVSLLPSFPGFPAFQGWGLTLCIMCNCGSLQPLPSVRGNPSYDNCSRHWSMRIILFYFILYIFASCVCCYMRSLHYPVSGFCSSKQYRAWAPSPGLKLNQIFVGHSHKFCTSIAPGHLAGRTDCSWRVFWLFWYPAFSFFNLQNTFSHQKE